MKTPICSFDAKSGILCGTCENKVKNGSLTKGDVEVSIASFEVLGHTKELPLPIFTDQEYAEEIRLKYRFLDLRRKKIHNNILLRSKVI